MPTTTGIEMLRSWLGEEEDSEFVVVDVVVVGVVVAKRAERTVKTH